MLEYEELIKSICSASYTHKLYSGGTCRRSVGEDDEAVAAVAGVVYAWASKNEGYNEIVRELGELKAKVYTYEQVIANSNFKPVIPENEPKETVADALSKVRDELITMLVEGDPNNEFSQGYHEAVRQALEMVQRHMRGDSE